MTLSRHHLIQSFVSVTWMIGHLGRRPLTAFAWYRFGIAGLTALLLITKAI